MFKKSTVAFRTFFEWLYFAKNATPSTNIGTRVMGSIFLEIFWASWKNKWKKTVSCFKGYLFRISISDRYYNTDSWWYVNQCFLMVGIRGRGGMQTKSMWLFVPMSSSRAIMGPLCPIITLAFVPTPTPTLSSNVPLSMTMTIWTKGTTTDALLSNS